MTQLTPTDTHLTGKRRDSPALWLTVAVGSLLLHLAAFWGMRWFNLRVSVAQPQLDAVPIELTNDAPQPNSATLTPAPVADPATADTPAPTPPAPNVSDSPEPPISSDIEAPPAVRQGSPSDQTSTLPPLSPQQNSPSPPSQSSTLSSPPRSASTPRPPIPAPNLPPPDPQTTTTPPSSAPPNSPSEAPAPSDPDSSPLPTGSGAGAGELPNVPVNQQENPQQPLSEITASLTARSAPAIVGGFARDVPDQSARPKATTRSFTSDLTSGIFGSASVGDTASCELKPEVTPYLNSRQPVALRVYIDRQGTVLDANSIAEENAYTQLAECLLKQWEFTPAMTAGSPVESDDLVVDVILTQN